MLALLAAESTGTITSSFPTIIIRVAGISAVKCAILDQTSADTTVYTTQELVQLPFFHFLFGNLGEADFFQLFHFS